MTQNKGRNRLLREFMRLLRPLQTPSSITWLSKDLAIGSPMEEAGWLTMRSRGVRAVVDLSEQCGGVASVVREQGMRYLRLPVPPNGLPEAVELHIVASWALQRIADGGSVLVNDVRRSGNDGLVACAILIKGGSSAAKAQDRLRNTVDAPLTEHQAGLLQQFVAQHVMAMNGR
jgi:hypothetical protein